MEATMKVGDSLLDPARKDLKVGGKLRAGVNLMNTLFIRRSGSELTGVSVDVMRELASWLDVPVEFVVYPTPGDVADAADRSEWDVTILAIEPARADRISFSTAITEIDATYVVHRQTALSSASEVDRVGTRIAAMARGGYELYLTRTLRHATLVRTPDFEASVNLFNRRGADVLAGLRPALLDALPQIKEGKLLEDCFATVLHGLGAPAHLSGLAALLNAFAREICTSGLLRRSIQRHSLKGLSALTYG